MFLAALAAIFLTKSSGPEQGESTPAHLHTSSAFFLYSVSYFGLGGVDAIFGLYCSNQGWVFAFHQFACQLIGSRKTHSPTVPSSGCLESLKLWSPNYHRCSAKIWSVCVQCFLSAGTLCVVEYQQHLIHQVATKMCMCFTGTFRELLTLQRKRSFHKLSTSALFFGNIRQVT